MRRFLRTSFLEPTYVTVWLSIFLCLAYSSCLGIGLGNNLSFAGRHSFHGCAQTTHAFIEKTETAEWISAYEYVTAVTKDFVGLMLPQKNALSVRKTLFTGLFRIHTTTRSGSRNSRTGINKTKDILSVCVRRLFLRNYELLDVTIFEIKISDEVLKLRLFFDV